MNNHCDNSDKNKYNKTIRVIILRILSISAIIRKRAREREKERI